MRQNDAVTTTSVEPAGLGWPTDHAVVSRETSLEDAEPAGLGWPE